MKRFAYALCLAASLVGFTGLTGCEDDTHHTRTVDVDDDKVTTKDTTIRDNNGSVTIEKKTTEKEYDDGKVKTETKTDTQTLPK